MDDVSGVADVSRKFANILTVSRKFDCNCVYVFHVIVPASQIWQKNYFSSEHNINILVFNIFQLVFQIILLQKLFKAIVFYKVRSMFLQVRFG